MKFTHTIQICIVVYIKHLSGEICGSCSDKVTILTPFPGWNEIDPEDLWNKIIKVRNQLRKK